MQPLDVFEEMKTTMHSTNLFSAPSLSQPNRANDRRAPLSLLSSTAREGGPFPARYLIIQKDPAIETTESSCIVFDVALQACSFTATFGSEASGSELILHLRRTGRRSRCWSSCAQQRTCRFCRGLWQDLQLGTEDSVFPGDGEVDVQKWSSACGRVEEDTYCGTIVDTFNIL